MTKHRLELFSDGVFAIILTLLVLDLRIPTLHQLGAFSEVAEPLVVHATSFFLVGTLWYVHQAFLAPLTQIHADTFKLNLLSLFWPTLVPFAARNAAERPTEPLGACVLAACTGFYLFSMIGMRLTAHSSFDATPALRRIRNTRLILFAAIAAVNLVAAALSWISPAPAYASAVLTAVFFMFVIRHPAELSEGPS